VEFRDSKKKWWSW